MAGGYRVLRGAAVRLRLVHAPLSLSPRGSRPGTLCPQRWETEEMPMSSSELLALLRRGAGPLAAFPQSLGLQPAALRGDPGPQSGAGSAARDRTRRLESWRG